MLYSSYSNSGINSDIPTVGISAHKFILSSCSQFFATMFETAPITAPNGVLYIVLPPELSHRAIQILVQYMYSGEATVSNDILNEVLRGGEILKIRGLCRTNTSGGGGVVNASSHSHHLHHQREREPSALYVSNGARSSLAPPPPPPPQSMSSQLPGDIYSSKASSSSNSARYTLEHHHTHPHQHSHPHHQQPHQHQQQQFRGLGASVMPKDSPVIVKSPKMASHSGLLAVASSSSSSKHHTGGISVNKEVAIDPEDKCCYQASSSSQVESLPQSSSSTATSAAQPPPLSAPAPMSICTEVGCSSCPLAAPSAEPTESTLRRPEYVDEPPHCERVEREDVGLVFERRLRRERSCERGNVRCAAMRFESFALAPLISGPPAHEYFPHEAPPPHSYEHVVKSYEVPAVVAPRLAASTPPHPHSFLTIKQEPTDWSSSSAGPTSAMPNENHHEHSQEAKLSPKQPLDFKINTVKLEANLTPHDDSEEHTLRDYNNFKLLVCEICQKSFEDTKTLVRHLGTHAAEPTATASVVGGSNSSTSGGVATANNNSSTSNMGLRALKTYVPKKRRRVSVSAATVGASVLLDKTLSHAIHPPPLPPTHSSSHSQQQENNMDHVTLLCDLCST